MSVYDEYGRHTYEGERDEDGDLRTEDVYRPEDRESDEAVPDGTTLLPVDAESDAESDEESEVAAPVSYDAATGSGDDSGEDAEDGEPEAYSDEPVLATDDPADGVVAGEVVSDEVVTDDADAVVADDVVADAPVAGDAVVEDTVVDEPGADEPFVADPVADDTVAAPVVDEPVATAAEEAPADEPSWLELKGLFVDDPAGAVAGAASKVDAAIAALRGSGTGDADTEQLRLAFRRYQEIHKSLTGS